MGQWERAQAPTRDLGASDGVHLAGSSPSPCSSDSADSEGPAKKKTKLSGLSQPADSEGTVTQNKKSKTQSESGSAAAQRAETQTLAELNQRSAGLGVWDVGIFHPAIHKWKYTAKGSSQSKIGVASRCTLDSLPDH